MNDTALKTEKEKQVKRKKDLDKFLKTGIVQNILNRFVTTLADTEEQKKGRLTINSEPECYTDYLNIVVGMLPYFFYSDFGKDIYGKELNRIISKYGYESLWIMIYKTEFAHEMQHKNSTRESDASYCRKEISEFLFKKYDINKHIGENFAANLFNIIEDGRIESILTQKYIGLKINFMFLNSQIRNGCNIKSAPKTPYEEYMALESCILSYAKTGYSPKGINHIKNCRVYEEYKKIQKFIDIGVESIKCLNCAEACISLTKDIGEYLSILLKGDSNLADMIDKMIDNNMYDDNEKDFNEEGQQSSLRKLKETDKPNSKNSKKKSKNAEQSEQNDSRYINDEEGIDNSGDVYEKDQWNNDQIKKIDELMSSVNEEMKREEFLIEKKQSMIDTSLTPNDIENINMQYNKDKNSILFKENSYDLRPVDIPSEIVFAGAQLKRDIERILTTKNRKKTGLKKGLFDTSSLWKIGVRNSDIFKRNNNNSKDFAFYILQDGSGSMSGNKIFESSKTLSILEEGLKSYSALKITTFSSNGKYVYHDTAKQFDDNRKYNHAYSFFKSKQVNARNKDGYSIRIATNELLKRKERKKVLILLSDGLPSEYRNEDTAINDVKLAVEQARQKGIDVIAVMFGTDDFIRSYKDKYVYMYKHSIISCSPNDIGRKIIPLLKSIIKG